MKVIVKKFYVFLMVHFDIYIYIYIYIYIHIQGVTGGTDQTSGECPLC